MPDFIKRYLIWRRVVGPLVTLLCATAIYFLFRLVGEIPIAAPILLGAIVLSAYRGGTASGLASAAIAIAFGAYHLSEPGTLFQFDPVNLTRFIVLVLTGTSVALTVGLLHASQRSAVQIERQARTEVEAVNRELGMLHAALEQVDYGVVLLDRELRAIFINRAFRIIWDLPDAKADGKPAFIGLMYHGRDTNAYAIPQAELDAYVAHRMALVRTGDETPLDLRLSNGEVIRFRCKTLPDGGRMLSYSSVTDLVRQAEILQTLATTDPMTGVYNRRRFFALAEVEWSRFDRYERPLSMLMVDIDHFKQVNDQFGHDVGDDVIKRFAALCRTMKRETDILARVGGEEFAILLPETGLEDAARLAERLRAAVDKSATDDAHPLPRITISVGVAQAGSDVASVRQLMKCADEALYRAKRDGRDRAVVFTAGEARRVA